MENNNPFITFGLCMVLALFMATWEWFQTKDKEIVKKCLLTSFSGSVFLISFTHLLLLLFPIANSKNN